MNIKKYLLAGLFLWVPLVVTIVVVRFMVDFLDQFLQVLPPQYQPDQWLGIHLPGLGFIFVILVLMLTGFLLANFLGNRLLELWEKILSKIPLVRSIYMGSKQVMNTLFSPTGESFRKVVLTEYPRAGLWSIAFVTNKGFPEADKLLGEDLLTAFVPTTPNPTSGYVVVFKREECIELKMTVDEALKLIISLGVVLPGEVADKLPRV